MLFVCTGNTCRSPMAEALTRRAFDAAGLAVRVRSAGVRPWSGPASDHARAAMRGLGLDIEEHRSQALTPALIDASDLVIGMTRDHVEAVVARRDDAIDRTFLFPEVVRLARKVGVPAPALVGGARPWAVAVASGRERRLPVGHAQEQVDDPAGQALEVYLGVAARLARWADELAAAVAQGAGTGARPVT